MAFDAPDTVYQLLLNHGMPMRNAAWTGNGFTASARHGSPAYLSRARSEGSAATRNAQAYGEFGARDNGPVKVGPGQG